MGITLLNSENSDNIFYTGFSIIEFWNWPRYWKWQFSIKSILLKLNQHYKFTFLKPFKSYPHNAIMWITPYYWLTEKAFISLQINERWDKIWWILLDHTDKYNRYWPNLSVLQMLRTWSHAFSLMRGKFWIGYGWGVSELQIYTWKLLTLNCG